MQTVFLWSVSCSYASADNVWRPISAVPTSCSQHAGAAIGSSIYVAGGLDSDDRVLDTHHRYDAGADAWTVGRPMPVARVDHTWPRTDTASSLLADGGATTSPPANGTSSAPSTAIINRPASGRRWPSCRRRGITRAPSYSMARCTSSVGSATSRTAFARAIRSRFIGSVTKCGCCTPTIRSRYENTCPAFCTCRRAALTRTTVAAMVRRRDADCTVFTVHMQSCFGDVPSNLIPFELYSRLIDKFVFDLTEIYSPSDWIFFIWLDFCFIYFLLK